MNIMTRHAPDNWKLEKLGQLFEERKEKVSDKDYAPLSVTKQGIVPQMKHIAKSNDGDNRKRVAENDFVINSRSDRRGSSGVSKLDGSVSLINIVLKPRYGHPQFIHHLMRSYVFQEEFYRFGHGIVADLWTTRYSELKGITVALPGEQSQKEIADFLDRETDRIDKLIEKKSKFSKVLAEKNQRKIDEIESLSDTGQQIKLRHLIRLNPGKSEVSHFSSNTNVTFLPMEAIDDGFGGINKLAQTKHLEEVSGSYTYFAEGDILLAKVTPCFENGKKAYAVGLKNQIGFGTSELHVLRIQKDIIPEYIMLLLSTSRFRSEGCISMTGAGGLKRVSEKAILDFCFCLPSLEKQQNIYNQIQTEIRTILSIINKNVQSISMLSSFKTALITEAVTGQLDIKAWKKRGSTDKRLDTIEEGVRT